MKLIYSPTSPYARKTRIVSRLQSLDNQITEVAMCPFNDKDTLSKTNPLGKLPALVISDNQVLYDSNVICDYLDEIGSQPSLWPHHEIRGTESNQFWKVRTLVEMANGIMDAAFALVMEKKRSDNEQSASWIQNYTNGIMRATVAANTEVDFFVNKTRMDNIALGCALGYLDFRLSELDWRKDNEKLAEWYMEFASQQVMLVTAPPQA
ncbi:glutathione S-transferase N-terminal domain-containing protein [Aliiglaciecola sp. M165]|uniref:glutathione S-transferase N-terminal domain-containing protein n=1 Tax=Aliiglaciecola sp. M165 TaxID=2593649 RepID=UPI00117D2359|nr:glutathione S-transferase N-terminal domain-containing protein [Aliiglaciecola sp. M165]TRY32988.1 glutathione S-transferase [Aliiglaciecola sp. M165]